jgi:hypothetical protein
VISKWQFAESLEDFRYWPTLAHAKRVCSIRLSYTSAPIGAFGGQINQPLVAQQILAARDLPIGHQARLKKRRVVYVNEFACHYSDQSLGLIPKFTSKGICGSYFAIPRSRSDRFRNQESDSDGGSIDSRLSWTCSTG